VTMAWSVESAGQTYVSGPEESSSSLSAQVGARAQRGLLSSLNSMTGLRTTVLLRDPNVELGFFGWLGFAFIR